MNVFLKANRFGSKEDSPFFNGLCTITIIVYDNQCTSGQHKKVSKNTPFWTFCQHRLNTSN
jgi:hypothetical protein